MHITYYDRKGKQKKAKKIKLRRVSKFGTLYEGESEGKKILINEIGGAPIGRMFRIRNLMELNLEQHLKILGVGDRQIILEWINGKTLAEIVENNELNIYESVYLIEEIAKAIQELHEKGVIYRNLAPEHVWIDALGNVKILPPFSVKPTFATLKMTTIHEPPMNVRFVAPEVLKNPSEISEKSDIYSLGAMAFYLCIRRTPFAKEIEKYLSGEQTTTIFLEERAILKDIHRRYFEGDSWSDQRVLELRKLNNPRVESIILSMLSLNAEKRPDINQILEWLGRIPLDKNLIKQRLALLTVTTEDKSSKLRVRTFLFGSLIITTILVGNCLIR